jgi:hypothetical protein
MSDITKTDRAIGLMAGIVATVAILGCGGDESGLDRRYPVSGTVTYKGQPVAKATVVFEPSKPPLPQGRVANGFVEDGDYTMTTATADDGALPGEYKVVIFASNLDVPELAKKQGGLLHQGDTEHQKALKAATSPIPTKYSKSETSGLTAKVEAKSNQIDFDLPD